jgi:hypothetical protein
VHACLAMKRAFHQTSAVPEPAILSESFGAAGKELRRFLWMSYLTSAKVDARFLGTLAWHIRASGGHGVDDIACNPTTNRGDERIKLVLGREFEDPHLTYISTVVHDKKNNQRSEARMPVHLPFNILEREYDNFQEPSDLVEFAENMNRFDCDRWHQHRVRRKATEQNIHWGRIVPAALYWDGVQFENRDSFISVCLRNLRTNVSYPMAILRTLLSCFMGPSVFWEGSISIRLMRGEPMSLGGV